MSMGKAASPEAVAEVRKHNPSLDDLPDEAVAKLFITHVAESHLAVRALGRAIRDSLPSPIRRLF